MNLNEYFKHQHEYHLSEPQKDQLFQRIKQKRREQQTARRHFSYKKIGYTAMALMLALFVFG
jgi:hypothetical protein